MLDDMNMHREQVGARPDRARERERPMIGDREVPLNGGTAPLAAMHRWLDGEGREAEARRDPDSAQHVEFWHRLSAEVVERGRVSAPAGLTDRIMAAIPAMPAEAAPTPVVASSAATASAIAPAQLVPDTVAPRQKPVELNPTAALVIAAGLVALGLVIGMMLG